MLKEEYGDIWEKHEEGHWIVIPTNGTVKKDGACVMGRGLALQAIERFPGVAYELGADIERDGNFVHCDGGKGLVFLPVKHNWWDKASMKLIESGLRQLAESFDEIADYNPPVYVPRLGCGNGGLDWGEVKPLMERMLDNRFTVIELKGK